MKNILEEIKRVKLEEVKKLKKKRFKKPRTHKKALSISVKTCRDIPIIAEIKRGSPSTGLIKNRLSISQLAEEFEKSGVCGISVITDSKFFFSSPSYLNEMTSVKVPVLRKDFILDEVQIEETASTCASSILLIVRFVEDENRLKDLIEYSYYLNLEPVIEVFNEKEVEIAKKLTAKLILVNNRDLTSFKVDTGISKRLIRYKEQPELWISGSGLNDPKELKELRHLGFDAFLIGTSIMKSRNPFSFINFLKTTRPQTELKP